MICIPHSFDDLDKGVYLVRRKNSDDIKEAKAGSNKRSVKLTDIIPFGQYNIGTPEFEIDRRSVVFFQLLSLMRRNKFLSFAGQDLLWATAIPELISPMRTIPRVFSIRPLVSRR